MLITLQFQSENESSLPLTYHIKSSIPSNGTSRYEVNIKFVAKLQANMYMCVSRDKKKI